MSPFWGRRPPDPLPLLESSRGSREDLAELVRRLGDVADQLSAVTAELEAVTAEQVQGDEGEREY